MPSDQVIAKDYRFKGKSIEIKGRHTDLNELITEVTEDLKVLEKINLLVDGDQDGYLIQIFSDTYIGPLFFGLSLSESE